MSSKTTIFCDDCGEVVEGNLTSINISGISANVRTMPDQHINLCRECWRLMRDARKDWQRLEETRLKGAGVVGDGELIFSGNIKDLHFKIDDRTS